MTLMRKFILGVLLWGIVLTLFTLLLPGCASAPSAQDHLIQALSDALRDGVVTDSEKAGLVQLLAEANSSINWPATLLAAGLSIGSSLLGVKLLPSRLFQGPFDPQLPKPV